MNLSALSGKSTSPVALRFGSKSTCTLNLDISAYGKRFLNSEVAWALAAVPRFFSSEEFNQAISAFKSLALMVRLYKYIKFFLYSNGFASFYHKKWQKAGSGTSSPQHKTAPPEYVPKQHKTSPTLFSVFSSTTPTFPSFSNSSPLFSTCSISTQPSPTLPFLLKLTGKDVIFFNPFAFLSPFSSIPFHLLQLGGNIFQHFPILFRIHF